MKDKVETIKKKLKLNDRDLAELLCMNRGTLYKRLKENKWHPHEVLYINTKYNEL